MILERLPDERLLLLITGLEPEERLDIINRQIRIDLAFVAPNTDQNELVLRQLAARALIDEQRQLLTVEVGQAVELLKNPDFLQVYPEDSDRVKVAFEQRYFKHPQEFAAEFNLPEETIRNFCEGKPVKYEDFVELDKQLDLSLTRAKEIYLPPDAELPPEDENIYTNFVDRGFYVSCSKLSAVISAEQLGEGASSQSPDLTKKIGSNSRSLREQLAEELMRCKLPLDIKPLVVVTGFKKMETLVEAKIWRGLSKLVDAEGWTEIAESTSEDKWSLSMLIEIVSGWLKLVSEFMSKIDGAESSEESNKGDRSK